MLANTEQATKAFNANTSPRYKRLDGLEHWVAGTQYDGRRNWWDDGVPLWERAPCIVYPVVQIAIQSNVDLVLGEGRFPSVTSKPGEDEPLEDNGLDEESSKVLDRFLTEHHKLSMFRSHCREAFASAQGCGTAVAIHGVRAGKPFADLIPAKWCEPELGISGEVLVLEIRYPYLEEYKRPDGTWAVRTKLYRRTIDALSDTTYLPADAQEDGIEPSWVVDPLRTIKHNLGFCPVVWYAHMKGCVAVNEKDGAPIHKHILDEIQAHDIALSQRHRGALHSEPQPCEIGVTPSYNPTETGRMAKVPASTLGGSLDPASPKFNPGSRAAGSYNEGPETAAARKKGPGYVWQYPDPLTKVQYLTYPGDALKAQDDNARDLRIKLQESLCVVFLDPENIKFAATTSGKALEAIKQKQIDRCDQFRDDLRDKFILPSIDLQLRIAAKLGPGMRVPGIRKIIPILTKFDDGVASTDAAA